MNDHISLGTYNVMPEETPRPALVPNPVDRFVTTVVNAHENLTAEQRARVCEWLQANGIDTKEVSIGYPITIEGRIYQGRKRHQVICFSEYHRNEDGRRYVDPRSSGDDSTAMVIQRAVRQKVELAPDPQDAA